MAKTQSMKLRFDLQGAMKVMLVFVQADITEACRKAFQASISDAAAFGSMLMNQLIHSHPSPNQNGSGNSR